MQPVTVEREIGGRILRLETGKLAKQAHGAVLVRYGDTVILTAAVEGPPRGGGDFFPLTVDYRERTYAAGKYPGGFKKREGAPSTKEILTMRLTDRPIRPLFPDGYLNEVQIMTTVLSSDRENDADVLSMIGASASLFVSHLPFREPIAAIRIGRIKDQWVVQPTNTELNESTLDLVVAGDEHSVCMIEGFARELPEDQMVEAIALAHEQIKVIIAMQRELRRATGRGDVVLPPPPDTSLFDRIRSRCFEELKQAKKTEGKQARAAAVEAVVEKIKSEFVSADGEPDEDKVNNAFHEVERLAVRDLILSGVRTRFTRSSGWRFET